jgi:hypothetical protein
MSMPAKYPVGYRREGFPELMGWPEVVKVSGRTDSGVRAMRNRYPASFPAPVQVLATTPVYLAEEVREFFAAHPRQRTNIDGATIRSIQGLLEGGASVAHVAALLEIGVSTVSKYSKSHA